MDVKFKRIKPNNLLPLLTEVSPYEIPLAFNLKLLYKHLVNLEMRWTAKHEFRMNKNKAVNYIDFLESIFPDGKFRYVGKYLYVKLDAGIGYSPYKFYSEHKPGKNRELHLMHPTSLLRSTEFINRNKNLLIYYTNRSNFSTRKPITVAKVHSLPAKLNINKYIISSDQELDSHSLLSDSIRSYFTYNDDSNYYGFFESEKFANIEKKYKVHYQLDISHCFASVYTHSISWATNGWHTSKRTFSQSGKKEHLAHTFGNQFDSLQQNINHKETNGILVGPELSRLFAEIILQRVDLNIEIDLEKIPLKNNQDYHIYRFVDDYHIFANSVEDLSLIKKAVESNLSIYKLRINESKEQIHALGRENIYLSAKNAISRSILDNFEVSGGEPKLNFYSASTDLQNAIKNVPKANKYVNYTYGILQNQLSEYFISFLENQEKLFEMQNSMLQSYKSNYSFFNYCESIVHLSFILYKFEPTYAHSIKLVYIVASILDSISNSAVSNHFRTSQLRSFVRHEILSILQSQDKRDLQVQELNLLDLLTHLKIEIETAEMDEILSNASKSYDDIDLFEIVILFRHFSLFNNIDIINKLFERIIYIIDHGDDPEFMTASIYLKIIFQKLLKKKNNTRIITQNELMDWGEENPVFDSALDEYYLQRLANKRNHIVY